MSPELQRLIEAYDAKLTCDKEEKPQRAATFERLFADALARLPGTPRDELLNALEVRHADYRRAQRKTSALPPKA